MIFLDHLSKNPPTVINFQDAAPTTFVNTSLVGIPGLLSGLWEGHNKFGRLEWAQLVQPAVDLSLNGFNVSAQLAFAVQGLPDDSPLRRSALFFPRGIPLAEGQVIQMPGLAGVLKSVAQDGVGEFYNGPAASRLVDFMKRSAEWTLTDLQGYRARTEPAVSGTVGRTTVFTSSAPTAGPQLISMLNILGADPSHMDQLSLHHLHVLIESMRITQNQIAKLGDPSVDAEVNATLSSMLNKTMAEEVAKQIRPDAILPDTNAPLLTPGAAASVVTVMDNQDNYVSLVTGLNSMFGSQLEAPDGYLLNDALAGFFPADPALPNSLRKPGQRPLQGLAPVVGTETGGRCGTRFVAGSSDATLLGQVVLNVAQFNQSAFEAVRAARLRTQAQSHVLTLEDSVQVKFPEEVIAELIKMGHTVKAVRPPYPSINVVLKNGGNKDT